MLIFLILLAKTLIAIVQIAPERVMVISLKAFFKCRTRGNSTF